MNTGQARRLIVLSWVLAVVLVSADEIHANRAAGKQYPQLLPCPSRFVKMTVAFTIWGVLGEFTPGLAAVLAFGTVLALFVRQLEAGSFPGAVNAGTGNFRNFA